ncbi:hypothetical protein BGX33_002106, partial [Mortierella sp. NVP41]
MYAKRPKVLIVDASLGGLALGMVLHKTDIPMRYTNVPLRSSLSVGSHVCVVPECLLMPGKFVSGIQVCNEKREVEYKMEFSPEGARFGPDGYSVSPADGYIITCSKLYELLLHRIPKDRIHFGKKV